MALLVNPRIIRCEANPSKSETVNAWIINRLFVDLEIIIDLQVHKLCTDNLFKSPLESSLDPKRI